MLVRKQFDSVCKQQWCIKSDQVLNLYMSQHTAFCCDKDYSSNGRQANYCIHVYALLVCAPHSCNLWLLHSHWRRAAAVIHSLLPAIHFLKMRKLKQCHPSTKLLSVFTAIPSLACTMDMCCGMQWGSLSRPCGSSWLLSSPTSCGSCCLVWTFWLCA